MMWEAGARDGAGLCGGGRSLNDPPHNPSNPWWGCQIKLMDRAIVSCRLDSSRPEGKDNDHDH